MTATPLEPLELASGLVLGLGERSTLDTGAATPLAALENAIRPALLQQPCLVSFSGGRDSSAMLAVAADLARREGHPLPVPVTNRFVGSTAADESDWQERVVSHLGLDDWVKLEHHDELDCVGPVASRTLLRHGLLWPFNAYFHVPLLLHAEGGSLLTGFGGDEMLSGSMWTHTRDLVRNRRRIGLRDLAWAAFAQAPRPVKRAVLRRYVPRGLAWLQPVAERALRARLAEQGAGEPRRWSSLVHRRYRLRYLHAAAESLGVLADDAHAVIVHPFLDPGFVHTVAALDRSTRFAGRTAAMRTLFAGLLPDDVLARPTKACFDDAFWRGYARVFAAGWSGRGVERSLVDPGALRAEWEEERPDPRSFLLAQSAWLHDHAPLMPPSPAGAPPTRRGSPSHVGA